MKNYNTFERDLRRLEATIGLHVIVDRQWVQEIFFSEIIVYLYLLSIQNKNFLKNEKKKPNPNSLLSLSLRDENEWGIHCSSSTTWLMINLFTSIVIYDVRRIGFTDNEDSLRLNVFWAGMHGDEIVVLIHFGYKCQNYCHFCHWNIQSNAHWHYIRCRYEYIYIWCIHKYWLDPRAERCKCAKRKIIRHEVVACGCVLLFRSPIIALKWMEEWCRVKIITVCYGLWSARLDR